MDLIPLIESAIYVIPAKAGMTKRLFSAAGMDKGGLDLNESSTAYKPVDTNHKTGESEWQTK